MPQPLVIFCARLMPPIVGGLERLSADTLNCLKEAFEVVDLSNRGPRKSQWFYLATIGCRIKRAARRASLPIADGSDATLSPAVVAAGCPSIVRIVGLDLLYPNRVYQLMIRRYLPRVTTLVAISKPTAKLLREFKIPHHRIRVIHPTAMPPANWIYRPIRGRILIVGRLVRRKGVPEFVQNVWPLIVDRADSARLDIIGNGPDRARLVRAIHSAPRRDRIHFHGKVPRKVLETSYARADVLVIMNRHEDNDFEGFGIVAAEAAVRGIPVIASRVDGLVDAVVPDRTGLLVPEGGWEKAADAIMKVVERQVLVNRGEVARVASETFGWERFSREYTSMVLETMETSGVL